MEVFQIDEHKITADAEFVIAKYDFVGESEEEIDLKRGQIFIVREKEAEWWR